MTKTGPYQGDNRWFGACSDRTGEPCLSTQVIRLGPGECPSVETGARYFAALAFPGPNDGLARQDAVAAFVGSYLHEANRVDESDAPFADDRLNAFVSLRPEWCQARLRTVRRRLRDRANLARALRPWGRDLLGEPHPPVPGIKKFNQRQITLHLCDKDPERASNFQKRLWRPGRPVIHHLVATDMLLSMAGEEQTEFPVDLASSNFIGVLVAMASQLAPRIGADPRFGVSANNLLIMEWVP